MKPREWFKFQKEDLKKRLKTYSRIRALLFFAIILVFLWAFVFLGGKIFSSSLEKLDLHLYIFLTTHYSSFLISFFRVITFFGSEVLIMGISLFLIIFLIQKKRKRAAITALVSLVGSAILVSFFKSFFERARPGSCPNYFHFLGGASGCFSFPSGHSTISFYFYGLITYLILRFTSLSKRWRVIISLITIFLVMLIAFSRLYLGLHFLSDVIGGFLLGGFWLAVAIFLIDFLY